VFFPCLVGAFGAVCTVVTRGRQLDGDVITSVGETIHRSSVLVVETQELGFHAPVGEEGNSAGVRGDEFLGIPRRHKFDMDVVAVLRVHDEVVLGPIECHVRETSGKVGMVFHSRASETNINHAWEVDPLPGRDPMSLP
jgi:hypothetical protein